MSVTRPLRSLRNRVTLTFALIVAGAIGSVYVYVVPRLEEQLIAQKLDRLERDAERWSPTLQAVIAADVDKATLDRRVRVAASRSSAEVSVLRIVKGTRNEVYVAADSNEGGVSLEDMRSIGERVALAQRRIAQSEPTSVGRRAIAAWPLISDKQVAGVAVFVDALTEVQANVALIRRRIIASGAVALVLAALAGYLVARRLTARVKRLEQAAQKVAAGDFSNPIRADSDDELGRLAAAFDDMQEQLARLDTARKQFIASASHELRTPIFSLGGFLELLEDEDLDEETRAQFLAQLNGQVARLRKLATELLDLSRLESGAVELRRQPTDVGRLARDVAGEFTPAAALHEAAVELKTGSRPIRCLCDPERVAQVMRILLDNALVHTPTGTSIVVSAARENGEVRLEVSDSGLGIKRQTMPHIFEPFYTSADGARGAGLGLAIARELAEQMQGELSVRSTPGSTTFRLTLPA
ncbi:MAG TPA: HAMP domain-containing sensor histidine kinase [Solirubrobacteraceae bacterium]|nr:HAMP domain-containing sensor histidine kinase [Solirubrobacteraceae bacterium]